MTAASTVRGLSVRHWKAGAKAKSAWAGADSGQRMCQQSLLLTTSHGAEPPWGARVCSGHTSHQGSKGSQSFSSHEDNTGMRFILSSILLHLYYIFSSVLLFICALLSTETSVWESVSMRTKIKTLEWWERAVGVMGWQSHLDDYFNTETFAQLLILYQCTQRLLQQPYCSYSNEIQ